jgi:hypothetical protein
LHQRFHINGLSAEQQSQLKELSENYIRLMQAGLDANIQTLRSIGLEAPEQTLSSTALAASADEIERQARHYQELCEQFVSNGTEDLPPAVVLAGSLGNTGAQLRASADQLHLSAFTAHNE